MNDQVRVMYTFYQSLNDFGWGHSLLNLSSHIVNVYQEKTEIVIFFGMYYKGFNESSREKRGGKVTPTQCTNNVDREKGP